MSFIPQAVLVTGGLGFIGSHVLEGLLQTFPAATVVNLDCRTYCSNPANLPQSARLIDVQGSITDSRLVTSLLEQYQIDTVIHLAAESHVDKSFESSLVFTDTNVKGTHVLLQCSYAYGRLKRFLHISTDEVYGETLGDAGVHEQTIRNPTNPYAASKAAAEMFVGAYYHSFGLPVIVTRGNNVFGPRQFPEKVIPKFICQLLRGQPLTIHGSGQAVRSFLYVTDVVEALLTVLRDGQVGEIYNIGGDPGHESTILSLAESLQAIAAESRPVNSSRPDQPLTTHVADRKFNDQRYWINKDKLAGLGWQPQVSLEDGLLQTWKWYQTHAADWWSAQVLSNVLSQ